MTTKSGAGFTLIELLVVITIIAILAVIGISVYITVQKNARDAKRQSDLRTLQSALEQYFADQFSYPEAGTGSCPATGDGRVRFGCSLTSPTGSKKYMDLVSKDPLSSPPQPQYTYVPSPSGCSVAGSTKCISYCLFAKTENISADLASCTPPAGTTYNFEVTVP